MRWLIFSLDGGSYQDDWPKWQKTMTYYFSEVVELFKSWKQLNEILKLDSLNSEKNRKSRNSRDTMTLNARHAFRNLENPWLKSSCSNCLISCFFRQVLQVNHTKIRNCNLYWLLGFQSTSSCRFLINEKNPSFRILELTCSISS